ncbi:hypothetical protein YC2023_010147 [Brassica napus]
MSGFLDLSRASLLLGDHVVGSQLWVCVRCFFFRCCRLSLEVPAAARNESRDSIHVSLVVSVLQSRALDCDSAVWIGGSLTLGSLTSSKVALFRRRVGGSNLQFNVPNDGTAYLWTLPRAAGLYPLLQGLSRIFLWELAATESLVPSHLSFRSSTLRYLRFIS